MQQTIIRPSERTLEPYISEGLIYGNWLAPVTSIPGNLVQIGAAFVIVMMIAGPLKRAANKILW